MSSFTRSLELHPEFSVQSISLGRITRYDSGYSSRRLGYIVNACLGEKAMRIKIFNNGIHAVTNMLCTT